MFNPREHHLLHFGQEWKETPLLLFQFLSTAARFRQDINGWKLPRQAEKELYSAETAEIDPVPRFSSSTSKLRSELSASSRPKIYDAFYINVAESLPT